jgi:hypothetical protein
MNKTPIDLVREYVFNTFDIYKDPEWMKQTILFLNKMRITECEFSETAWDEGYANGRDGGNYINFNEFYKQYEQ